MARPPLNALVDVNFRCTGQEPARVTSHHPDDKTRFTASLVCNENGAGSERVKIDSASFERLGIVSCPVHHPPLGQRVLVGTADENAPQWDRGVVTKLLQPPPRVLLLIDGEVGETLDSQALEVAGLDTQWRRGLISSEAGENSCDAPEISQLGDCSGCDECSDGEMTGSEVQESLLETNPDPVPESGPGSVPAVAELPSASAPASNESSSLHLVCTSKAPAVGRRGMKVISSSRRSRGATCPSASPAPRSKFAKKRPCSSR